MQKNTWKKYIKYIPVICIVIGIVVFLCHGDSFTPETLLSFIPKNPLPAMLVLWFLYAGKSLMIIFPVLVLQITAGYLFSPMTAVLVNLVGMTICFFLPYIIGRMSREDTLAKLEVKYPKMQVLRQLEDKNALFVSFFLRMISILPMDVVSMYLGAEKLPILPYWLGSIAGTLPAMLSVTFLGQGASKGSTQVLAGALAVMIAMPVISYTIYKIWKKKK